MKWSKLKQSVEDRFAKSVQGKVHLYTTRYHMSKGRRCMCGRGWITVNGVQIVNFETIPNLVRRELANSYGHLAFDNSSRTPGLLCEKGEFARVHLIEACTEILQSSIDSALQSTNPLMRSLAFLDARAGKRRLLSFRDTELHPLAKTLLNLRFDSGDDSNA